jgi:hypothetical protein
MDFLKALQANHPEVQKNKKQKNSFSFLFSDFDQGGYKLKPMTNKKPIPKQIDPKLMLKVDFINIFIISP